MIDLGNRWIADDGTVVLRQAALEQLLFRGDDIDQLVVEPTDDVELYHQSNLLLDSKYGEPIPYDNNINKFNVVWFTPEPWASIDVEQLLDSRCQNLAELDRCHTEMVLFRDRQMIPILRQLLYMIDTWRAAGVVWGIGRGSSVSSFVLYLIGINRINPMQFNLNVKDFFK